jgi:hypothetical protein
MLEIALEASCGESMRIVAGSVVAAGETVTARGFRDQNAGPGAGWLVAAGGVFENSFH